MINKACRGPSISIRQGDWKLIMPEGFWPTEEGIADLQSGKLGKGQLYNLAEDVGERNNRCGAEPDVAERLANLMVKYVREGRSRPAGK
jgi:hypothetical protein